MITQSSDYAGGSEQDFLRLLSYLNGKYKIYSIFPEGARQTEFINLSDKYLIVPKKVFPISGFKLLDYLVFFKVGLERLFKIISFLDKNRNIDLCFLNSSVCFLEIFPLLFYKIPYIQSIKEKIGPNIVRRLLYKLIDKTSKKVLVISEYLKSIYIKETNSKKVEIIYSALEESDYLKIAETTCKNNDNDIIILNIGNIYSIKGQECLLRAFIHFKDTDIGSIKLKFIGDIVNQEYYKKLVEKVTKYDLENKVEFLGSRLKEEVIKNIINSYCVVITSMEEGQSLVLLETLLLEIPVITTKVGIVPEIIIHMENGIIYDYNNDIKLYELIKLLIQDTKLYTKIKNNCRKTYYSKFNLNESLRKYEEVFAEVMN